MRRMSAAIATLVLLASACSSGIGKAGDNTPAQSLPPAASHPGPATAATSPAAPASPPDVSQPDQTLPPALLPTFLIVAETGSDGLQVITANTGEQVMSLPAGVPAAGWKRILTATPSNGRTVLAEFKFENIDSPASLSIDGTWRFPTIGDDPALVGLSGDASTQVLVDASAGAATSATSSFALVLASLQVKAKIITLDGHFDYDAISLSVSMR